VTPDSAARARTVLGQASWAADAFARYDRAAVERILIAVATAAADAAADLAAQAVSECGFGVVADKVTKNLACSTGLLDAWSCFRAPLERTERVVARMGRVPDVVIQRPYGVILAETPAEAPVAAVYYDCLAALATRNAVIISPGDLLVSARAAHDLGAVAVESGAPAGVIQVAALPVGTAADQLIRETPGNVPVLVDASAELAATAKRLVDAKSFDHSLLPAAPSVLVVDAQAYDRLLPHLRAARAHLLGDSERDAVRQLLFPDGRFDDRWRGCSAAAIASEADLSVPAGTRVLLAPLEMVVPEEPLAGPKACPVLGVVTVPSAERGIAAARAVARLGPPPQQAAIHSRNPATVLAYGTALDVARVDVNVGRQPVARMYGPSHLQRGTRVVPSADDADLLAGWGAYDGGVTPPGPVPPYPLASNVATPFPSGISGDGER
jgi:acetaldehyde dehydrogenase / alcohol dehydrogenase